MEKLKKRQKFLLKNLENIKNKKLNVYETELNHEQSTA